jgi:hypothetical protein
MHSESAVDFGVPFLLSFVVPYWHVLLCLLGCGCAVMARFLIVHILASAPYFGRQKAFPL